MILGWCCLVENEQANYCSEFRAATLLFPVLASVSTTKQDASRYAYEYVRSDPRSESALSIRIRESFFVNSSSTRVQVFTVPYTVLNVLYMM